MPGSPIDLPPIPDELKHLWETNAKRPVVKLPAQVLRQKATEVGKVGPKIHKLVEEMTRVMKLANGIGLAAPQLGVGLRVIVVAPDGFRPTALINPTVVSAEGEEVGEEGCLSIPGLYGDVVRPSKIEVHAFDRRGNPIALELEGMPARVVLHEIDHLDGVLFIDKVIPETVHWMDPEKAPERAE